MKVPQSYCQKCGTEILTCDNIIYCNHCKKCFYKIYGEKTDPWEMVKERGKEIMKVKKNV